MRVAIIYDCLYPHSRGGGERVYRRIAEMLAADGAEVDYLTRRYPSLDKDVTAFSVVPIWEGEIAQADGTRNSRAAFRFARSVYRALRRRRGDYDLVIASALPVLTLLAARAALGGKAPLVGDWLEVWPWAKWRAYAGAIVGTIATVLQWLGARAAWVHTVNSDFTARRLNEVNPSASIVVLGLFDLVDGGEPPRPAADPPVAVYLGRLIPDKRAHLIPAAIADARRSVPRLRAVIAGGGPERERIEAEVARLGLERVIDIPGFVDDDTAVRLIGESAVLVNPSIREGFGLVVAEAAAAGVPSVVIAGGDNAAADLIVPDVNGALATDPDRLGDAIAGVVLAGEPLRERSRRWFVERAQRETLAASLHRVLDMVGSPATGADRRSSRRG